MTQTDTWTIGRLLQWTSDYLKEHGSETSRLDAEVLLAHARGCDRIALYTEFEEQASDALRKSFRELVKRRAQGMPVAYLVGEKEFYSLSFRVNQDVLIPRPETEFVVITALDLIKQYYADQPIEIADIGTGSGILAICLAKHAANASVTAVDVSPAALAIAEGNAEQHQLSERICFVESDLFEHVPDAARFDLVVSNPPYVGQAEYESLPPTVRDFEPQLALLAGPQGTESIAKLISQADERLNSGGWLLFETCPQIIQPSCELVRRCDRFAEPTVVKDLAQLPRVVVTRKAS